MGCRLLIDKEVAFENPDVLALGAEGIALRYTYRIRSTPVLHLNIGPGQCSATPEFSVARVFVGFQCLRSEITRIVTGTARRRSGAVKRETARPGIGGPKS